MSGDRPTLETVLVPSGTEEAFARAEERVSAEFEAMQRAPDQGILTIGGQRYVLMSADSLSVSFHRGFRHQFPELSESLAARTASYAQYDLAFAGGKSDAARFHREHPERDPVARLSCGPVHFAHAGWARVSLWSGSRLVVGESFFIVYDHAHSFEADAWIAKVEAGKVPQPTFCVCAMSAGYSAGWCTQSFVMRITAREVSCRARGDARCRFVMAREDRLEAAIREYEGLGLDPEAPLP